MPFDSATGAPKLLPSMTNCTVPPGVTVPELVSVTVAVKETGWPNNEGLAEEATIPDVAAWATEKVNVPEPVHPFASVTVIVNVNVPASSGVPTMATLVAL
jgi:hypothetical protein